MAVITKAERHLAMAQALANTRISGHVPTDDFLRDCDAVVGGLMTTEQAIEASLARAVGQDRLAADAVRDTEPGDGKTTSRVVVTPG
jgi:hypothetical protein